jgi:hypothetical protein
MPFIPLTLEQFASRLRAFQFTRPVTAVHMHHTFSPRQTDYRGLATIEGMFRFHTETNHWSDIAQHLSIAPDGTIWTGRDWNRTPASATGFNDGVFMFETIGDFDVGQERLEGEQRRSVIGVIALVQIRCGLPIESLHFHREFTNAKTCPGTGIRKDDIVAEVRQAREQILAGSRALVGAMSEAPSTSRRRSVHAMSNAAPPMNGDEGEVDCGPASARDAEPNAPAERGISFSPDDLSDLRRHVVNLRQGKFSGGGVFETSKADVDAIFAEHLPPKLAEAKQQGRKLRVVVWAHGGLVDEESGLSMARAVIPWWMKNDVYPIYFVWETGLFETITQLIKGRRELGARDLFDVDGPIEDLVRAVGGGKIWDGMKQSAQRSVEPDGGALYVAQKLAAFCAANPGDVELHASGHSAGAIFHSHFVPTALGLNNQQSFSTISLLAPAIRVSEFKSRLVPRLGHGVDALTMFTMRKDLERADNCATLYRKSLLYLISMALEADRSEPILGLDQSIRNDADLMTLFGIGGGGAGPHQVIFSKTSATSGRSATRATSHGGFDNDVSTMESVLRRVLNVGDAAPIEPFPADTARAFSFDAALLKGEFAPASVATQGSNRLPAPRPPSATPATHAGEPRLLRALCVGINAYPGARLGGCVNDANDWARVFRRLNFQHVDLLLDEGATQAALRKALRDLVASGRPGDVLAFQYSGHGTSFQDESGPRRDENDGKDEAIVTVDYQQGRFILDDELFEIFSGLAEGVSLTCFFDCCHSGSMSRAATLNFVRELKETRDDDVKTRFIDPTPEMRKEYRRLRQGARAFGTRSLRSSEDLKAIVFSACRDDELALERAGHGVFTTRVTPTLQTAFDSATTNAAFQTQIVQAFGAGSSQNPALDCASRGRDLPLLLGVRAPGSGGGAPVAAPVIHGGSDGGKDRAAETWSSTLNPLTP